ncbi:MAG: hypothetical protein KA149_06705 [Chitinophagales bacterium]|nr:hypothetical protein [Chitinophagales bacterium]
MHKLRSIIRLVIMFVFVSVAVVSCNWVKEIKDNAYGIQKVLDRCCDCEEVRMQGYNIKNGYRKAQYDLVGCQYENREQEAQRLLDSLKANLESVCKIDELVLDFVNKKKHYPVVINNCEVQPEDIVR